MTFKFVRRLLFIDLAIALIAAGVLVYAFG